jgi:hypothetical protein
MAYTKNPNIIEKDTDAGLLVFDTQSGRMMELNPTARLLWQKSGSSFESDNLKKIIETHCAGVKNLDQDVSDFIKTAIKLKMVTENGKA